VLLLLAAALVSPLSPKAEATDLKSVQYGFESHRGHAIFLVNGIRSGHYEFNAVRRDRADRGLGMILGPV
jgi:hypothetical protein